MKYTHPDHTRFIGDMKKIGLHPFHYQAKNPIKDGFWQGPAVGVDGDNYRSAMKATQVGTECVLTSDLLLVRPIDGMGADNPDKYQYLRDQQYAESL